MLYSILGFVPNNISLYKMAMTHSSSASGSRKLGCNERLEFLGDAVLSSVTADFLYSNFRKEREGFLTKSRSNLVCRERLNELALEIGLDRFISSCGLQQQHNSYIYGNALEALIGAIYIDKGYSQCRRFLLDRVFSRLNDIEQIVKSDKNYKSRLIEWGQKNHHVVVFRTKGTAMGAGATRSFRCTVLIDNLEVGHGMGSSKKEAEQHAAQSVSYEPSDEEYARILDRLDKISK